MTLTEVNALCSNLVTAGHLTDYAYYEFSTAPTLPFATYTEMDTDSFVADNKTYFTNHAIRLELYSKTKSTALETAVETALADRVWDKFATERLPEQNCFMTAYEIN